MNPQHLSKHFSLVFWQPPPGVFRVTGGCQKNGPKIWFLLKWDGCFSGILTVFKRLPKKRGSAALITTLVKTLVFWQPPCVIRAHWGLPLEMDFKILWLSKSQDYYSLSCGHFRFYYIIFIECRECREWREYVFYPGPWYGAWKVQFIARLSIQLQTHD
jgi:hypothetical protein